MGALSLNLIVNKVVKDLVLASFIMCLWWVKMEGLNGSIWRHLMQQRIKMELFLLRHFNK